MEVCDNGSRAVLKTVGRLKSGFRVRVPGPPLKNLFSITQRVKALVGRITVNAVFIHTHDVKSLVLHLLIQTIV